MSFQKKEYPCAVCKSSERKKLYQIKGFDIVKCLSCSFVYVNPRVSNEDLPKLYSENYFNNSQYGYLEYEATAHLRKKNFERWFKDISPFLTVEKGNVLDIGCASGYFLETLRTKGWDVQGIELDTAMIEVLNKKNIPVYTNTFNTFQTDKKYHLITLFDVLEHLPDTDKTFEKLASMLHPEGIIALITPDISSLQHSIFRKRWFQFKPQEHIHYFSPKTLQKSIESHQLKIIHIQKSGQYADMNFILNRLQQYGFSTLHKGFATATKLVGLHNACFYSDTGSMLAILKGK
ncbi:MAG: class I SAM-dependent methyltransferase [Bacteroidia bacterium]